jgi:hypothetical protein
LSWAPLKPRSWITGKTRCVAATQASIHRLPARFGEILAEAGDYSRLVQTRESQQISGALGLLTILGLPLGTSLGILQVLDDQSVAHLLMALGLSIAATAGALTTRYGRLVLSSLRGGIGKG